MTLVRPLMTNFKMTVTAECTISACSPFLLAIKTLTLDCQGWGESPLDRCPLHPKYSEFSFSPPWHVYWLLSGKHLDPAFGNTPRPSLSSKE